MATDDERYDQLLMQVAGRAGSIDNLLRDSRLPASIVWTVLLELELAGRLERQPGGKVALLI